MLVCRAFLKSIRERDERDRTRPVAPLVQAPDAVTIDSTSLSIEEVARNVLALAASRQGHIDALGRSPHNTTTTGQHGRKLRGPF